jgi:hypothetical protein
MEPTSPIMLLNIDHFAKTIPIRLPRVEPSLPAEIGYRAKSAEGVPSMFARFYDGRLVRPIHCQRYWNVIFIAFCVSIGSKPDNQGKHDAEND